MARHPKAVGGENIAFEKLNEGLRHSIEAATELGVHQQRPAWTAVATLLQKVLANVGELHLSSRIRTN